MASRLARTFVLAVVVGADGRRAAGVGAAAGLPSCPRRSR